MFRGLRPGVAHRIPGAPRMSPAPSRSPRERADRRVAWLVVLGGMLSVVGQALPDFLAQAALFPVWWNAAGLLATAALVALAAVGLWLPQRLLRVLWWSVPALVVTLQLSSYAVLDSGAPPVSPWVWRLEPAALTLLVFVARPAVAVGATIVAGGTVALSAWMFTGAVPLIVAWNTPFHMSEIGFVVIFLGIRNRVIVLNESEDTARRAAEQSAVAAAIADREAGLARLVHDEVLSVLNAALMFAGPPPQVLRDEAATAVGVLDRAIVERDRDPRLVPAAVAAEQVRERLAASLPEVRVEQAAGAPVPSHVLDAVAAAALEAVRNAHRHARAGRVAASVRVRAGGIRVVVSDDGVGFDPRAARAGRMGLAESIAGRMADIGGAAGVESAPGEGTRVWVAWDPAAS